VRVLLLHSDVAPDAAPDELDTLYAADCIEAALKTNGHDVGRAAFTRDPDRFEALIAEMAPEVVFNLVEAVDGLGSLAGIAPRMLDELGVPFTGADAVTLALTSDKLHSKRRFEQAGIPTPPWCEAPLWDGLDHDRRYIVKSVMEDASLGLDADAIVVGLANIKRRAECCAARWGGKWFAEQFIDGREFNIGVIERDGQPVVLPLAEMTFEDWPADRPKIVGWDAKWAEGALEYEQTIRVFGLEDSDPALAARIRDYAERTWRVFDLTGSARVDMRVDRYGTPWVLEVNPNPSISPDAGLSAAAEQAGLTYPALIETVLRSALRPG
jgi:D-alanine-D-alanine ligase